MIRALIASLLTCCVIGHVSTQATSPPLQLNQTATCIYITQPQCTAFYDKTAMPNILGHQDQRQASYEWEQMKRIVESNCSPTIHFYLCSVFFPECNAVGHVIPPCQSLCHAARKGCRKLLRFSGYQRAMDCKAFPEAGVCVNAPPIPTISPSNVVATAVTSSKIMVAWQKIGAHGQVVEGYRLYYTDDATLPLTSWQQLGLGRGDDQATLTGLRSDVTYVIRVGAYNSVGSGPMAEASALTPRLNDDVKQILEKIKEKLRITFLELRQFDIITIGSLA